MTASSSLEALTDALANDALKGELSWQAVERALQLAEQSQEKREEERERREWLRYAERVRGLRLEELSQEELWREFNWARYWWLKEGQTGWLEDWQRRLQSALLQRSA